LRFREILMIASKGQGTNTTLKRYSLAVGPAKKTQKLGCPISSVQAFLKRKEEELGRKTIEKRRKQELLKKGIELKHDKKARAMAKRTKDNFHGNGIPVEESKKRQAMESHTSKGTDQEYEMEEEEEFLEYNQAASEQEYEEEQEPPPKVENKPKVPLKSAPPSDFTDLLRLAEKKQYEPVEIKVVKKQKSGLRLHKNIGREGRHMKKEPEADAGLPLTKKVPSQTKSMGMKPSRVSGDKHPSPRGTALPHAEKKSRPSAANKKHLGLFSSKSMPGERTKVGSSNCSKPSFREDHDRSVFNGAGKTHSSTYSPNVPKTSAKRTQKSVTEHKAKNLLHPSHSRPGPVVTPHKAKSPGVRQPGSSSPAPGQPITESVWPTVSSGSMPRCQNGSPSSGPERSISGTKRPASDSNPPGRTVSSTGGSGRPISGSGGSGKSEVSSGGPGWPVHSPHMTSEWLNAPPPGRSVSGPGGSVSGSVPAGWPISSSGPRRPVRSLEPGSDPPHKPKCIFASETVSSKNIITQPSNGQMNGMKPSLAGYRSAQGSEKFPFPRDYKRLEEHEDYDSEMEDFIEDEGESQEKISKHIFGYDRKKYKDESDYALCYIESSWREEQKEEAKSLRPSMQEDFEGMRQEEEATKCREVRKLKRR
uniref:Protein SPT2 homolog n=1 Tax=Myotis lucifugus TaxID=59463 RepID=G1Q3A3_MYOLU